MHEWLAELEASLAAVVPRRRVTITGGWSSSTRSGHRGEPHAGAGAGEPAGIADTRWSGTLTGPGPAPIACIAFLLTRDSLFWTKSRPATDTVPVDLCISAWARDADGRATFAASVGGAHLPGVPVRCGTPEREAVVTARDHETGRLTRLVRLDQAELRILPIPGSLLRVGRKRLWRLRAEPAAALPPHIRELLTRGRRGSRPL